MLGRGKQRGDTLIEVLFAVTLFSFVTIGALSIMNQGTSSARRSLEITLVRQEVDAQAEALRLMNDSYVAAYRPGITYDTSAPTTPAEEWYQLITTVPELDSATSFGGALTTCPNIPNGAFIIDTKTMSFMTGTSAITRVTTGDTYAKVVYDSSGVFSRTAGLWIEAIESDATGDSTQDNTGYIDFHIRACWEAPGLSTPMTIGTIVRLYEPRG